jgi:dipeptidyl-peptidase-4
VLSRRQERALVLAVDPASGSTELIRELTDPDWVDVVPGTPAWTSDGRLLTVEVVDDRYALCVDGAAVSPPGQQVRRIVPAGERVLVHCSEASGDEQVHAWSPAEGFVPVSYGSGSHVAAGGPDVLVLATSPADSTAVTYHVTGRSGLSATVRSLAEEPGLLPAPRLSTVGERAIPTAVLLPSGWDPGSGPLPVLLDPYGGPHFARVRTAARAYLEAQWWADQGFCVVVADGRGTPGTPSWERSVRWDLAGPALDDQVAALHGVADELGPEVVDLGRVAIRGWSFGGFLSALAVLARPDVFHAAVAGAPVTDMHLYDTAYTERYLGLPDEHPEAYESGSLVALAPRLTRPLLVIHGLADDNVVAAHSLRLSSALLAAGRPHTFLPLSGVTHMTPQEVVAENLLLLQLDFLRRSLSSQP